MASAVTKESIRDAINYLQAQNAAEQRGSRVPAQGPRVPTQRQKQTQGFPGPHPQAENRLSRPGGHARQQSGGQRPPPAKRGANRYGKKRAHARQEGEPPHPNREDPPPKHRQKRRAGGGRHQARGAAGRPPAEERHEQKRGANHAKDEATCNLADDVQAEIDENAASTKHEGVLGSPPRVLGSPPRDDATNQARYLRHAT